MLKLVVYLAINGSGSSVSESVNVVSLSMNCSRNLLYALPYVFSSKVDSYIHRILHQIIFVLAKLKIYCILMIVNVPNLTVLN